MTDTKYPAKTSTTTRRAFLKRSAAATAGAATLTVGRSAHAAGSDTIRIGVIGCGGRGTFMTSCTMTADPHVNLVAMCDVFDDRLQNSRKKLKEQFGDRVKVDDDHCFVGFDGYKNVIDSVDVVLITCASKFHPMYAEAAIQAGKHVFVEKPHGIDPVGVRRMQKVCALAKQKNLSIVSGLQSRFHVGWQEIAKRIHDGAIGDIVSIQCMFLRKPYVVVPREPNFTEVQYHFRNWYHFCWLSGDDLPQSLVHNLDRASWMLKEQMPTWAFGLGGRSASFGEVYGDMFDHHTVVYEYASGPRIYAMSRTQKNTYHNYGDIIAGTKGTCDLKKCLIQGETNWQYEGPKNMFRNASLVDKKALMDAVRSNSPLNCGHYMNNSTMLSVMGQLACYTGKPTTWKDVWESDFSFEPPPEKASFDMEPPTKPDKTGNYPLPRPGVTKLPV